MAIRARFLGRRARAWAQSPGRQPDFQIQQFYYEGILAHKMALATKTAIDCCLGLVFVTVAAQAARKVPFLQSCTSAEDADEIAMGMTESPDFRTLRSQ